MWPAFSCVQGGGGGQRGSVCMCTCVLDACMNMEGGGFLCLNRTMGCADPPFLSNPNPAFTNGWGQFNPVRRHRTQEHISLTQQKTCMTRKLRPVFKNK